MKFCTHCGASIQDDAIFCTACGGKQEEKNNNQISLSKNDDPTVNNNNTPAQNNVPPSNNTSVNVNPSANNFSTPQNPGYEPTNTINVNINTPDPTPVNNETLNKARKQSRNKMIGLIAVVICVIAVVAVIAIVISKTLGGSYKKPINDVVSIINKPGSNVLDLADSVLPDFGVTAMNDTLKIVKNSAPDAYDELTEQLERFEDVYDALKDEYGKDYKITVEFKSADRVKKDDKDWKKIVDAWEDFSDMLDDADITDEDTIEDIAEELEYEYDADFSDKDIEKIVKICESLVENVENVKIQDAYKVKLKVNIDGKKGSDSDKIDTYVVKINGKWVIDPATNFALASSFLK